MLRSIRWCVAAMAACWSVSASAADFFFKDGDVVVMIGDSITEQHLYSNYVEMWTVTRYPNWKLTFRNVGIGGDRSVGGNSRFARDVAAWKPTAMTVDFGMNDGGYRAFGEDTFKPYMDGLQGMANLTVHERGLNSYNTSEMERDVQCRVGAMVILACAPELCW